MSAIFKRMLNSVLKARIHGVASTPSSLRRKRLTSLALFLEKQLEVGLVQRLPCRVRVSAERRMSISSYLILRRRVARRPTRTAPTEPLWSRWYVPLLAAALALVALIVATVAALDIVTATH